MLFLDDEIENISNKNIILPEKDAELVSTKFIEYFSQMLNIEDYLRYVKKTSIRNNRTLGTNLDGSYEEYFFNQDIHPEDMEFDIRFVGSRFRFSRESKHNYIPQEYYNKMLDIVSSHNNESNIPGRELRWVVYEKNTNTIVGFIRFGSPTINSKPRNEWLGKSPDLSIFNQHSVMGFVIVPSQPFGYNYLGGKLLALLCCSHFARENLNTIFEKDICLFETTSLYGSSTDASQYDGLKPFIRYKGLTESKFLPLLHDEQFNELHKTFKRFNKGNPLTDNKASSKKLKRQTKMISIIRNSLSNETKLKEFNDVIDAAFKLTQKKRFYVSDYGYENVKEVILGKENVLRKGLNWDKFYLENIISLWKKKATKRYEKLKLENRFRNKVELWINSDHIQIIR